MQCRHTGRGRGEGILYLITGVSFVGIQNTNPPQPIAVPITQLPGGIFKPSSMWTVGNCIFSNGQSQNFGNNVPNLPRWNAFTGNYPSTAGDYYSVRHYKLIASNETGRVKGSSCFQELENSRLETYPASVFTSLLPPNSDQPDQLAQ